MAVFPVTKIGLFALISALLVASVTALPTCSPRVCCLKKPVRGNELRIKRTKLCNLELASGPLASGPVVSTCFFGAYVIGGFGACPGVNTTPTPSPAENIEPCSSVCPTSNNPRVVCDLINFPATCDVYNRLFGMPSGVARVAATMKKRGPRTWADVQALLQGA
ncbi:hypothetical protein MMPV_004600 [Pyropia vietnamensis]